MTQAERRRNSKLLNWVAEVARLLPEATFHVTEQEDRSYCMINVRTERHNQYFITHFWGGGDGPEDMKVWTPEDVSQYFRGIEY